MIELMADQKPSRERLAAFHRLRGAARLCPNAAYNLGNYLSEDVSGNRRRHRPRYAMELFASAAEMGLSRLRNADEPYSKAPRREGPLRDIISRALTNIGGKVSNAGKPLDAVKYFQQSISIYPDNPNSHVCLGNMGVYHGSSTGITPLEGIKSWKKAGEIGDYCHESSSGCPCRANVVAVSERLVRNLGEDLATQWIVERYRKSCHRRSDRDVVDVVTSAADTAALGIVVPPSAASASRLISDSGIVARLRKEPLEVRVTILASALGTFINMAGRPPAQSLALLAKAKTICQPFEPLRPILAEEDWRFVGPPDTDYLNDKKTQERLAKIIYELIVPVAEMSKLEDGMDGAIAILSHLDNSFRRGVSAMVEYYIPIVRPGTPIYIPATYVGEQTAQ
jgi:tetratricopeptide (TPR) repeat protein